MIHYDLHCTACGYDFDDWFSNSADWEARRSTYACPSCGATGVEKALMAPSLGAAPTAAERCDAASASGVRPCADGGCPFASGL